LATSTTSNISSAEPPADPKEHKVGYSNPPRHSQFRKGVSGNPTGRPKRSEGISIKEILDGDQRGKNGEVISRREAYVIALVNDALGGNQKAFSKFMKLMHRSGLLRAEESTNRMIIEVPTRPGTVEDFMREFGRPSKPAK
jgi:DNA phosphorothioation-dependent restriction protein DptG